MVFIRLSIIHSNERQLDIWPFRNNLKHAYFLHSSIIVKNYKDEDLILIVKDADRQKVCDYRKYFYFLLYFWFWFCLSYFNFFFFFMFIPFSSLHYYDLIVACFIFTSSISATFNAIIFQNKWIRSKQKDLILQMMKYVGLRRNLQNPYS